MYLGGYLIHQFPNYHTYDVYLKTVSNLLQVYNRTYDLPFDCDFDLQAYPFDYQTCYMDVSFQIIANYFWLPSFF
jgi:hypothetical protein